VPVGWGVERQAFGLVTTLPWSGAHATVFRLGRTMGDLRPALAACLARLGGVPEALVIDNDASVVAVRVAHELAVRGWALARVMTDNGQEFRAQDFGETGCVATSRG
jgi:hypothetical protein